jgi:hypothetical protein
VIIDTGVDYRHPAKAATRVEYRVSGSGAWIAADSQLVVEDLVAGFPGDHTSARAVASAARTRRGTNVTSRSSLRSP